MDVVWYDLSLVFSKPERYFVVEFKKELVADFTVVDSDVCGAVHVPTEVKLHVPDMFGPESQCLMDIAVTMQYPAPQYVIVLERVGVVRNDGHWFITHKEEFQAFPVGVESLPNQAPDPECVTQESMPRFKTSKLVFST